MNTLRESVMVPRGHKDETSRESERKRGRKKQVHHYYFKLSTTCKPKHYFLIGPSIRADGDVNANKDVDLSCDGTVITEMQDRA